MKGKAPNSKLQAPEKLQIPIPIWPTPEPGLGFSLTTVVAPKAKGEIARFRLGNAEVASLMFKGPEDCRSLKRCRVERKRLVSTVWLELSEPWWLPIGRSPKCWNWFLFDNNNARRYALRE